MGGAAHRFDVNDADARRALYFEAQQRRALRHAGPSTDELLARIEGDMIPKAREVHRAIHEEGQRDIDLLTSRRAGKTTWEAQEAEYVAIKTQDPVAVIPYISLTRDHAKTHFWPILKDVNERLKLGFRFNEADLVATAPGGTRIRLYGLDDIREIVKVLGGKMPIAFVDECQDQPPHLQTFVESKLGPALADFRAPLIMSGTPEPSCTGYFYDRTEDALPRQRNDLGERVVFCWDIRDNPKFPQDAEETLEREAKRYPLGREDPGYKRDWLGRWHRTAEALVYSGFDEDRNTYTGDLPDADWCYGFGLDFGAHDATTISVGAYCYTMPVGYIVESWGERYLPSSKIIDLVVEKALHYKPRFVVLDPASGGANLALDLEQRFAKELALAKVTIQSAEKQKKLSGIAMLNDDFLRGRILVNRENAEPLIEQLKRIPWHDPRRRDKEKDGVSNDYADSALYLYREMQHYVAEIPVEKPKRGTAEHMREQVLERKRRLLQSRSRHWTRRLHT